MLTMFFNCKLLGTMFRLQTWIMQLQFNASIVLAIWVNHFLFHLLQRLPLALSGLSISSMWMRFHCATLGSYSWHLQVAECSQSLCTFYFVFFFPACMFCSLSCHIPFLHFSGDWWGIVEEWMPIISWRHCWPCSSTCSSLFLLPSSQHLVSEWQAWANDAYFWARVISS